MSEKQRLICGALLFTSTLSLANGAQAITPIRESTLLISAERLVASNLSFYTGGGVNWENQFFGAPGSVPLATPRLGIDYFVVDGLSVGGHVGFGFSVPSEGASSGWVAFEPRVGYAFSISRFLSFWPRVGVGFIVTQPSSTALISLEAMFLANLNKYFAIEFGPAFDVPLSSAWPDAVLGANGGFVVRF